MKAVTKIGGVGVAVLGVAIVAGLLFGDEFTGWNGRIRSSDYSSPADRLRALRKIVPFEEPAEDVLFDVTRSEGILVPGPAGLEACIVVRVSPTALHQWVEGWREASSDTALDISCARELIRQWPGARLLGERRDYRRSDADEFDMSEERVVFEGDGVVVWRIVR